MAKKKIKLPELRCPICKKEFKGFSLTCSKKCSVKLTRILTILSATHTILSLINGEINEGDKN